MKILLYGHKGWIGQQFSDVVSSTSHSLVGGIARCDDAKAVRTELATVGPTHVVSMIGRTHGKIGDRIWPTIDYLEQPNKLVENLRDNLVAPMTLAKACADAGIHFTYLGTGCIFEYDDEHPINGAGFKEYDEPNFTGSSYSTVKGATDRMMRQQFDTSALNLRIRMPITAERNPRNFVTKITTYEKICSMTNSMTVLPTLLPRLVEVMERKVVGTLNFTNPGTISHNEILELYRELVDPTFVWGNFSLADQAKILASARSNNCLDTTRLEELCANVPSITNAVRECLTTYKSSPITAPGIEPSNGETLTGHPSSNT